MSDVEPQTTAPTIAWWRGAAIAGIALATALGGLLGAIIAIPLAGALRVLVVQVLAPAEREWSGAESRGGRDGPESVQAEE